MQYTITHRGVPIGIADVEATTESIIVAPVVPLPAYTTLSPTVRAASLALADSTLGMVVPKGESPERREAALALGATLGRELELRDAAGALVSADFIELTEWPGGNPEVAAFIGFRDSHTAVPASVLRRRLGGAGGETPAT